MRPRPSTLALMLLSTAPVSLVAQELPRFRAGDTLRLRAPEMRLRNTRVTFAGWQDSTLSVRTVRGDSTITVPFPLVARLDRYAGKNRLNGALRGAAILGTVGMLAGAVAGRSAVAGCREFLCEMEAFKYAAAGMFVGVAVGAPVGATAMAPDRWHRVELPVALGFPDYRKPFVETAAFRILWGVGSMLVLLAVS